MTYLDHASRGLNSPWRYALGIVLGPLFSIGIGAAILLPLSLSQALPADLAAQVTQPSRPLLFFAANGVIFAALLVGFQLAIKMLHKKAFADIVGNWRWGRFVTGFLIWLSVLVGVTLIDFLLSPGGFQLSKVQPSLAILATVIVALMAQTFAEEFIFRGYLTQGLLLTTRRPLVASLISGLMFGALHIPNGLPQAANAVVFGIVLSVIAIRTGGIAFTFGLHLVNNLFGAVVVVSANDVFKGSPSLITQNTPHLSWWDMAAATVALLIVLTIVVQRSSREPPT